MSSVALKKAELENRTAIKRNTFRCPIVTQGRPCFGLQVFSICGMRVFHQTIAKAPILAKLLLALWEEELISHLICNIFFSTSAFISLTFGIIPGFLLGLLIINSTGVYKPVVICFDFYHFFSWIMDMIKKQFFRSPRREWKLKGGQRRWKGMQSCSSIIC